MLPEFGEPAKPRRKAKAETDGSTARVEEAFKAAFAKRFPDVKQMWSYGRDRKILKGLVAQLDEETVATELIPEFFATADPQVTRLNYTVPDLQRVAQRLLLNRSRKGKALHPRTAENVAEARKATGDKE